ncbi:MAG: hypothetical protein OEV42_05855 [Deltaproteobacteria bacterium]|nr:hypothetical protein [Deltaproteobacteria bacterium]
MKKTIMSLLLIFLFSTNTAIAGDSDIVLQANNLAQSEFEDLSRQVGLAVAYKAAAPAEPLGITGFDIGLEVTATNIDEGDSYWKDVAPDMPGSIPIPKVRVQKGLPFGIDIGASYAKIPDSDIKLTGAEIKYAIWEGGIAKPALALRGTYTKLDGIDDLDLTTTGVDLSISKGFAMLTPYAGVGQVWIKSDASSNIKVEGTSLALDKEEITETKYFVGARLSLGFFIILAEYEQAEVSSYTAKLSLGF